MIQNPGSGRAEEPLPALLARFLDGDPPAQAEIVRVLELRDGDSDLLATTADEARSRHVGELVTWVVNRNLNFTNVCVKRCQFCAYARGRRSEQGYWLDTTEVVRRAEEAVAFGATEVCIQGGLAPDATPDTYLGLLGALRSALPMLHIHAFSPEEVKFGAGLAGWSIRRWLEALQSAGLNTIPGTSAEILDDTLRDHISPGRVSTAEWLDILRTAHGLGIRSTATMMYGHGESTHQQAAHLLTVRDLQRETGGITEFVPLAFVHEEAPLFRRSGAIPPGPTEAQRLAIHATSRLVLGPVIPNLQVSWVKEGPARAIRILQAGANDLGGTLVNESISTSAGSGHGQRIRPAALRAIAHAAGRPSAERTTLYRIRDEGSDPSAPHPLDAIADDDPRFGSYDALTRDAAWRYEPARAVVST